MASSNALAECSPKLQDPTANLLPDLDQIQHISKIIALRVAQAAIDDGVAPKVGFDVLQKAIDTNFWIPEYREYKRVTFNIIRKGRLILSKSRAMTLLFLCFLFGESEGNLKC